MNIFDLANARLFRTVTSPVVEIEFVPEPPRPTVRDILRDINTSDAFYDLWNPKDKTGK